MSRSPRRFRQLAGLALVILAYLGGILGWSWAVQSVERDAGAATDTTAAVERRPVEGGRAGAASEGRSVFPTQGTAQEHAPASE